jgi:integrase
MSMRVAFRTTYRRFTDYEKAAKFLYGLRLKADEGIYDPRDYQKGRPLGLENLVEKYLDHKSHLKAVDKYRQRLGKAVGYWGNRNVKTINYGEIEDFIHSLAYTTKYIHDIATCLKGFFRWLERREEIEKAPRFPSVSYVMGYRKIVSKETQLQILEEVKRISWHINPRIYIGILWLSTYISLRPSELIAIKEGQIDLDTGRIIVPDNKGRYWKYIYLLEEDVKLLWAMPKAFPEMYFFRHFRGNGNAKPGQ